jgi:hypothetical protein
MKRGKKEACSSIERSRNVLSAMECLKILAIKTGFRDPCAKNGSIKPRVRLNAITDESQLIRIKFNIGVQGELTKMQCFN